jgi:peptide/nickel transport system substrate-binding protein
MIGWANSPQLDAYVMLNSVLHTKGGKSGAWNPGGYSNPKLDELTKSVSSELDMAKRQKMISEAFTIHRQDFGSIPLYLEPLVWATRKGVDVVQTADNKVRLWWIKIH